MTKRGFFSQLGIVTILVASILLVLHYQPLFQPYADISIISLLFFIGLSLAIYFFGLKAAKSDNKNVFIRLIMGVTFGKMMFSLMLLFIYYKVVEPQSGHFLVPFFIVYFCYTIFETFYMMKLGKMKID